MKIEDSLTHLVLSVASFFLLPFGQHCNLLANMQCTPHLKIPSFITSQNSYKNTPDVACFTYRYEITQKSEMWEIL